MQQNGTEGSNPSCSATQSSLQRSCPALCREIRTKCPYFASFRPQSGLERTDYAGSNGIDLPAFLWTAFAQSGFGDLIGRMQRDHKPMMWRK